MKRITCICAAVAVSAGLSAPARAQPAAWSDRGYISISGDLRISTLTFTGAAHPIDFAEPATVTTTYDTKTAPGLDVGVGIRVWRNLGVGADVSYLTKPGTGSVNAEIPHPLFFNKPRTVVGDATGLGHDETALHLQAVWMAPVTARWSIALAGGPSWIVVGQDLVDDINVASVYPFDSATFEGAVKTHQSKGRLGFNAGADATYRVRRRVGVGFGASYSLARVPLALTSGETLTVSAGGARAGGGLRVRF